MATKSLPHLPVDDRIEAVRSALAKHRAVVVVAEPGAGKTSRVPPALLVDPRIVRPGRHAVMLQPRRAAARSAAAWIAHEQGWKLGETVGYQVRFENRTSRDTRLQVVTEGILTRRLLADPELSGCDVVILDEFHERSLDADLALVLLRESQTAVREDLSIVVMSATIDAARVAAFLGDCPIVEVPGRAWPVTVDYARSAAHLPLPARIGHEVEAAVDGNLAGDVLVFLPGQREIRDVEAHVRDRLGSRIPGEVDLRVLHGSLPLEEQIRVLMPGPRRRIILSTNVAETSLTIEGVSCVIDSGLVRQAGFDDADGFDTLRTRRVSEASARQRAGRAGRTGPGRCIRMWSPQESLEPFDKPEIQRLDLTALLLDCFSWGWPDPSTVDWIDPPPPARIAAARETLVQLGAVGRVDERITPIGRAIARLPVHPRLGRVLIEARRIRSERDGALVAAIVSERDFLDDDSARKLALRHGVKSDLLLRVDLLRGEIPAHGTGIDTGAMHRIRQVAGQLERLVSQISVQEFAEIAQPAGSEAIEDEEARLAYLLLSGFSDRLCRRSRRGNATAFMARGMGVRVAGSSQERDSEFFLALDPRTEDPSKIGSEPIVRVAIGIGRETIETWLADRIVTERVVRYDDAAGKARCTVRKSIHHLVISEGETPPTAEENRAAFSAWVEQEAESAMQLVPEVTRWLARYRLLRGVLSRSDWPEEPAWAEAARGWASGCTSRDQLRHRSPLAWMQSTLPAEAVRLVADELPESIELPNGRTARIEYDDSSGNPCIAGRVQDFFGWKSTPRIALGRIPLLLEILAPNQRPVQRTLDLESFWKNTYPQVRKDLRGRYPKHHWPEDPSTATPGPSIRRGPKS